MLSFGADREWRGLEGIGVEILETLRPKAEAAVVRVSNRFVQEIQKTLTGQRSGRTYKVSKTGKLHTASAPLEPPAVLTGRLRASWTRTEPVWEGWTVSSEVGSNVEYAQRLEFGGLDSRGVMIKPRPYLQPTIERMEPIAEAIFEKAL